MNYATIVILIILTKVIPVHVAAQCDTGTEPECHCDTAPILCSINELDGYSSTLSSFLHPADGPDPLCDGIGVPDNPMWFSFYAWCSDIEITVELSNCTVIDPPGPGNSTWGAQVGVYADCSSYEQVGCIANDCNNEDDKILSLSGLDIGEVYHFMIDGCLGSACDFTISVVGSCAENIEGFTNSISGEFCICEPGPKTYLVDVLENATSYHWYVDGVEVSTTDSPEEIINWNSSGTFELCVDASNACVDVSDDPPPICVTVSINGLNNCSSFSYFVAANGFWDEPSNWSGCIVPDQTSNVIILAGNNCTVRPGTLAECKYMEVQLSATLDCSGTARITVYGP